MFSFAKKAALSIALAATALTSAAPASAQDFRRHRGGGDATGTAIAAGIIGLAVGAIIVSSTNRNRDRDRDRRFSDRRYYNNGYVYNNGYNNGYPQPYRGGYYGGTYDRNGYPQGSYDPYGYQRRGYRDGGNTNRGYDRHDDDHDRDGWRGN
jgi:hypothetical protein